MKLIYAGVGVLVLLVVYCVLSWRAPSMKVLGKFEWNGEPHVELHIKNPAMTGAHIYGLNRNRPFAWYNAKKVDNFEGSRMGGFRIKGFGKHTISVQHPDEFDGAPVEKVGVLFRAKGISGMFGGGGKLVTVKLPPRNEIDDVPVPDYLKKFAELNPESEEGED